MPLPLALRGRVRQAPVATALPTTSGTPRVGQTLTLTSPGTWSIPIVAYAVQWQTQTIPSLFWDDIPGETADTLILKAEQIGKQVRAEITATTLYGAIGVEASAATTLVQDNPSAPLQIIGTPVTSALQGDSVTFTIDITGGRPATVGQRYSAIFIGSPPAGSSIAMNTAGDRATVTLGASTAGTFTPIRIRATDSIGQTADLGPWTFTVTAATDIPILQKGSGWTAPLAGTANIGSSTGIGYGHKPGLWWCDVTYDELTQQTVLEFVNFHTGPKSAWDARQNPTWGVDYAEAQLDNGPAVRVPVRYSPTTNRWSFKVIVDPDQYPDGVYTTSGTILREVRIRSVPFNGDIIIGQGDDKFSPRGFRFCTNANGTLAAPVKYVDSVAGNDANSGNTANAAYKTLLRAFQVIGPTNGNSIGGARIKLRNGTYTYNPSGFADNRRWAVVEADTGQTNVVINSVSGSGLPMLRLRNIAYTGTFPFPTSATGKLWLENPRFDRGASYLKVGDVFPISNVSCYLFVTGGSITNWPNSFPGAVLIKDMHGGTIACDTLRNCHCVLNSKFDVITSGRIQSSPGVNQAGDGFHPDALQIFNRVTVDQLSTDLPYGGCFYNIEFVAANAQGPYFDDNGHFRNVFLINFKFVMDTVGGTVIRNAIFLMSGAVMYNSIFYDVDVTNGLKTWRGSCNDVVAVRFRLHNMIGGDNSLPGGMTVFAA
jgi:hypothetical protein